MTTASIIIPTYNRAYIVGEALESALAQTYGDFEVVVLDDGSTDNTEAVVRSFRSDKIRYFRHETNRGYSAACNSGVANSTGKVLGFLDSDDVWMPEKLQRQIDLLNAHPEIGAVFTDVQVVTDSELIQSLTGRMKRFPKILERKKHTEREEYFLTGREIYLCLLEEVPIKPTAFLCKRELYELAGHFDEAWPSGTDWDLFLRLSRFCSFGYINEQLAIQRRTPDATHLKFREKDKLFLLNLFLAERRRIKDDAVALEAINRGIADHYRNLGSECLHAGHRGRSILFYLRAFKDTGEALMLLRAASAFMPLSLRDALVAARHSLWSV